MPDSEWDKVLSVSKICGSLKTMRPLVRMFKVASHDKKGPDART